MTLSKTARVTRQVLRNHRTAAVAGLLTTEDVVRRVQWELPHANREGIMGAIEDYGPLGEDDCGWYSSRFVSNRFYNPKTGEALE